MTATDRTEQDLVGWLREQLDEIANDAQRRYFHTDVCARFLDPGGDCSCDYSDVVLTEVETKRRILDLHVISSRKTDRPPFDAFTGQPQPDEYEVECELCGWAGEDPMGACLTVRLLALPYAANPGYRPEWAP